MNTRTLVLSLAALAASACASTGIAVGDLHDTNHPQIPQQVKFVWKADAHSPERGEISGDMPDGKHYTGRYYEVMENVPEEVYAGAWGGAEPYWPDWPVVSPKTADKASWNTFAAQYTGLAIAKLTTGTDGPVIRCRFNVKSPTAGLVRGGTGECKLSDGSTISNVTLGAD